MFESLNWILYKEAVFNDVIKDKDKLSIDRKLKNDTVIYIVERTLMKHAEKIKKLYNIEFNPLNNNGITYILEHSYILDDFPEEKRLIKTILKSR